MADIKDLSNSYSNGCKGEFDETAGDCDGIASPKVITRPPPPALKRRNSTGTIYVETTMACQDNNAMIHVVCVVIRAHMLSNAQERHKIALSAEERALYDIFNEDYNSAEKEKEAKDARVISNRIPNLSNPSLDDEIFVNRNPNPNSDSPRKPPTTPSPPVFVQLIPSLAEIEEFFCTIYNKSQLESECIIMALIYCERIIIKTKGKLKMVMRNWKAM